MSRSKGECLGPDGILAIQKFGQLTHLHPHIHGLVTDGRLGQLPINLTQEPFPRIWENNVFRLLRDENRIEPAIVARIRFLSAPRLE